MASIRSVLLCFGRAALLPHADAQTPHAYPKTSPSFEVLPYGPVFLYRSLQVIRFPRCEGSVCRCEGGPASSLRAERSKSLRGVPCLGLLLATPTQ
jgi:hypothetical protein